MTALKTSSHTSKMLVLTALDHGAGDITEKGYFIAGVGSARLHLKPLLHAAQCQRIHSNLLSLDVDQPSVLAQLGHPNFCIVGKINHYDDSRVAGFAMAALAAVARLKVRGVKIGVLYCDHLAPLGCSRGELYRDLLRLSDHCIVPCQAMADRASPYVASTTPITVIEDPWQVRLQAFHAPVAGAPLRVVWFGNTNNVFFLANQLEGLMFSLTAAYEIELVVLSSAKALEIVAQAFRKAVPFARRPWSLRLVEWDDKRQPYQLEKVLGSAHVAWLPSDPSSPIKGGVSHNRLVDAVRSGCIVVANSMQSYQELRQISLLGVDHGSMINLMLPQYERIAAKYETLRNSLLERFSPDVNHRRWQKMLSGFLSASD